MTIVKVQRPIVTNDPAFPGLVYAKGRKGMIQQRLDVATLKAMGNDYTAFFVAELKLNGQWQIRQRVGDQKW